MVCVYVTHYAYDKWNNPSMKLGQISYQHIVILLNHIFSKTNLTSLILCFKYLSYIGEKNSIKGLSG